MNHQTLVEQLQVSAKSSEFHAGSVTNGYLYKLWYSISWLSHNCVIYFSATSCSLTLLDKEYTSLKL